MANRILKGLAVVAGTGLAMGFTAGRTRVRPVLHRSVPPVEPRMRQTDDPLPSTDAMSDPSVEEDFLDIEPLLDRLERVEARIESIDQRPRTAAPAPASAAPPDASGYAGLLADLERRVEENTRELGLLRESVTDAERRATEAVAAVQRSVEETRAELPALVERHVTERFDDLRSRFAAEIEQSHQRTLATFERAIDEKISTRIGSIERALADQAGSIEALRVRATETDNNLQRLVTAIEKLCERAQLIAPAPEPQFTRASVSRPVQRETRLAFESQMHDAMQREPVRPVIVNERLAAQAEETDDRIRVGEVQVPPPAFTGNNEPAPKKSRFLFRNLVVAGFGLLASRFLR